jgi:hypothetical protein
MYRTAMLAGGCEYGIYHLSSGINIVLLFSIQDPASGLLMYLPNNLDGTEVRYFVLRYGTMSYFDHQLGPTHEGWRRRDVILEVHSS